ncbi:hypothetical protein [Actinomadura roseirufa]|uniref:hypothetical protein n=1 Tax=Actinomadura roseirufa TaxID=2094049 RepID=UPI001041AEDE|nr:hypothetical protein [Actinomadura roseirufa]
MRAAGHEQGTSAFTDALGTSYLHVGDPAPALERHRTVERAAESGRYIRELRDTHILPLNEQPRAGRRGRGDLTAAEASLRAAVGYAEKPDEVAGCRTSSRSGCWYAHGALDEASGLLTAVRERAMEHGGPVSATAAPLTSSAWLAAQLVSAQLKRPGEEDAVVHGSL